MPAAYTRPDTRDRYDRPVTASPPPYSRPRTGSPTQPTAATGGPQTAPVESMGQMVSPATLAAQEEAEQIDFRQMAGLLYPWLVGMPELLDAFVAAWTQFSESPNAAQLALAEMRNNAAYDRYFAGNRTPDGRFRLDEQTYLSTVDGYARNLAQINLNPDLFRPSFSRWIQGDVSVLEQGQRLSEIYNGVMESGPDGEDGISYAQRWFANNYGIDLTPEAVVASALDPSIGRDILARRVSMAQVGGAALAYGYERSLSRVDLLSTRLSQAQALQFYSQARERVRHASSLSTRFNEGTVNVDAFEDANIFGDVQQQTRMRRNLQQERASFENQQTAIADRSGGLTGLDRRGY